MKLTCPHCRKDFLVPTSLARISDTEMICSICKKSFLVSGIETNMKVLSKAKEKLQRIVESRKEADR